MDLSAITTLELQAWRVTALQSYAAMQSGGRPTSVSYSSGDGSKAVTYQPGSIADLRVWLQQLANELAARGVIVATQRRRAIGVRFG